MAIIGIDLGTTNSLVSYFKDGTAHIIPNALGKNLTPSVVSVDEETSEILIGEIAKERLITNPKSTVASFKRFMGTDKTFNLGEFTFRAEELSALILKALKNDAESFLGEEVTEAVISVPAYFNEAKRKATKLAGELAGLTVHRIISEPTAAALAYGLHMEKEESQFLIFDLGGGTFDVSIIDFFHGVAQVKAVAGDNYLGGDDFTNSLVNYFIDKNSLNIDKIDKKTLNTLTKECENLKKNLAINDKGVINLSISGKPYCLEVTRDAFDKITLDLSLRIRTPIERALRDADVKPSEIEAVILIGGSSRMSLIKTIVAKIFGKLPYININPDEAVALGAAIQGAIKDQGNDFNEIILTDVCPYTLGISIVNHGDFLEGGVFLPIIERNTPIPVSIIDENLTTVNDNQKVININVYQGESRLVKNNLYIGTVEIEIPPAPKGQEYISVRFSYDVNSLLEVEAYSYGTKEKKSVIFDKLAGNLASEDIEAFKNKLKLLKIHPREQEENRLLLAYGERLYEEALGETRDYIGRLLEHFSSSLVTQNPKKISKVLSEVKERLEEIEKNRF